MKRKIFISIVMVFVLSVLLWLSLLLKNYRSSDIIYTRGTNNRDLKCFLAESRISYSSSESLNSGGTI